jgi:RNA polymerase sigma factor (sigma-70 family)
MALRMLGCGHNRLRTQEENRLKSNFESWKTMNQTEQPSPDAIPEMTDEYFGTAYKKGFKLTVRFLLSRGLSSEAALETAQAAWTKGWERREQLRQPKLVLTWTNSIALNIYRTLLRRERPTEPLPELEASTSLNVAAIDVERMLTQCRPSDRTVLEEHYIGGYKTGEIAEMQGCSETAVRLRLFRARKTLQRHLITPKLGRTSRLHPR